MNAEQWEQMNVVFHHAVELPEAERLEYLQRVHRDNPEISRQVDELLRYHFDETRLPLDDGTQTQLKRIVRETARLLSSEPAVGTNQDRTRSETLTLAGYDEPPRYKTSTVADDRAQAQKMLDALGDFYEFREFLGSGGGGVVARVWDKSLHRTVALKILRRAKSSGSPRGDQRQLDRERSRLLSESRNLAKVHSDHIVQIFDVGESAGCTYLAMELVDGPSLRSQIKARGALAPKLVAQLCYEVAMGLQEAHQHGIVHRDIKPSNILLAPVQHQAIPWREK